MSAEDSGTASLEGIVINDHDQALKLARSLTNAEQGDAFVRQCVRTPAGKSFLACAEWAAIQRDLVAGHAKVRRASPADDYVDGADAWDAFVDEMAALPTVKMAYEFLCRLQSDELGRAFLESAVWGRFVRARFPGMDPASGKTGEAPQAPRVGDDVLYVSYGTPGGEFGQEERTARVTEVGAWLEIETTGGEPVEPGALRRVVQVWDPLAVQLFVMNPGGTFHAGPVEYDAGWDLADGGHRWPGGTWHWPSPPERTAQRRHVCPEHGTECSSWVPALGGDGGVHVGPPRWKS